MADKLVLVSGASGFVASHIVKLLQETGYRVRGTVRSLQNLARVGQLSQLADNPKHPLQLVEADLERDEGWAKAMDGVYAVMHTASPFPELGKYVSEESVCSPAVEGTKRVLDAAATAGVKKFVLTSSVASVAGNTPVPAGKIFTEDDWTNASDPNIGVYFKSKTLAERAAWDFVKVLPEHNKLELTVVNPSLVVGPILLASHQSATSVAMIKTGLVNDPPLVPQLSFPFCDVRDVARVHLACLANPETVGKRHLVYSAPAYVSEIREILAAEFNPQGCKIGSWSMPNFIVHVLSWFSQTMKTDVAVRLNNVVEVDPSRMVKVLGIQPTPLKDAVLDLAYSLFELGVVDKPSGYTGPKFSKR
ncbi:NAD-dependent epimerase/dehydratase [Trinorchestia longiramus]|nr:NAD-dependent epimerase/dehydratase [Trinorchestia longiramus]